MENTSHNGFNLVTYSAVKRQENWFSTLSLFSISACINSLYEIITLKKELDYQQKLKDSHVQLEKQLNEVNGLLSKTNSDLSNVINELDMFLGSVSHDYN